MVSDSINGRLISFDEAGFTGPNLVDESQPYFIYASHDLTVEEAQCLADTLRRQYRIQGNELKATRLKKRKDWEKILVHVCEKTRGRTKIIAHNKKAALAGKFFEYFFEPVLCQNSMLFYSTDFHRYIMNNVYQMISDGSENVNDIMKQMQAFMRSFDPTVAPSIFSGNKNKEVEMDRILRFCRGYSKEIIEQSVHLRTDIEKSGKWTLDLTTTSLFSLLFYGWGHTYSHLRLLCDDSKPLSAGISIFNGWVGQDQSVSITDGKSAHEIRGNLVAPVKLGSSATHPTLQVADLLAGIAMDTISRGSRANQEALIWLQRHQHRHSIDFQENFTQRKNPSVAVGREILKELARRADANIDPLEGMPSFVSREITRASK